MNGQQTALTQRLGLRVPILQAPLPEPLGTPDLVAAVSVAGGLGTLDGSTCAPDALQESIAAVRTRTDRPFAVHLSVPTPRPEPETVARATAPWAPYLAEWGIRLQLDSLPGPPDMAALLAVVHRTKVPALVISGGLPDPALLKPLREAGIAILGTATHLLEAIVLEESGADYIIAQGAEAGGMRGTFVGHTELGLVGNMTLVPLLAQHIKVPVIAAGGIMNGRGIAAATVLGAAGVQMGTAFLACPESGTHPAHKTLLREGSEMATTLSCAWTGRPARVLRNRITAGLRPHEATCLGFPWQWHLTAPLRAAAMASGTTDAMALWAGQGAYLCEDKPVAELIDMWMAEMAVLMTP